MATRYIEAGDGVRIAVYEEGNAGGPTVVFVHGWPDSHVVWDGVAALLAADYRVIRYDNRGAGESSVPEPVSAYALARLADDFAAVADAVSPHAPVHHRCRSRSRPMRWTGSPTTSRPSSPRWLRMYRCTRSVTIGARRRCGRS